MKFSYHRASVHVYMCHVYIWALHTKRVRLSASSPLKTNSDHFGGDRTPKREGTFYTESILTVRMVIYPFLSSMLRTCLGRT